MTVNAAGTHGLTCIPYAYDISTFVKVVWLPWMHVNLLIIFIVKCDSPEGVTVLDNLSDIKPVIYRSQSTLFLLL
jgi:hypothetical protein